MMYHSDMQYLFAILVGLIVAAGLGYFIGYDHGFQSTPPSDANATAQSAVSDAAQMMSNIVGMWQSIDDPKFTREIRNDGTAIDSYAGASTTSTGHGMVFTKEGPDSACTGSMEEGSAYLSLSMNESEKLYFKIITADADSLDLIYLDRGNALSFNRVK